MEGKLDSVPYIRVAHDGLPDGIEAVSCVIKDSLPVQTVDRARYGVSVVVFVYDLP